MQYLKQMLWVSWGNLSFHASKLEYREPIQIKRQFAGKKPYTLLQITPKGRTASEHYRQAMQKFLA